MQKKVLSVFVIFGIVFSISFILVSPSTVYSAGLMKYGGLEVTKTKAQPIQDKEDEGYTCFPPGKTFEGTLKGSPKGTPTSWLIVEGNKAPSKGEVTVKRNIILSYLSAAVIPIVCYRPPADIAIVKLHSVLKWQVPA